MPHDTTDFQTLTRLSTAEQDAVRLALRNAAQRLEYLATLVGDDPLNLALLQDSVDSITGMGNLDLDEILEEADTD